ncbi:MAG: hypothetical protein QME58_03195 [Bacteroidota bacterium]|nr:hypothetical protein [Bacteroidota bacterium]
MLSIELRAWSAQKLFSCAILVLLTLAGCKPVKEVVEDRVELPPPLKTLEPAITINIASIDLSDYPTKTAKKSVQNLATALKAAEVQIVTLQSVTRYPELKNRVDFIFELQKATEMFFKFGEIQNYSGRQTGNAIFSIYPFRASENSEFNNFKSLSTSLNATIDVGVANLLVSSLAIPEKLSSNEQKYFVSELNKIHSNFNLPPFIITGNINSINLKLLNDADYNIDGFVAHRQTETLTLLETHSIETEFGKIMICKFGLFNKTVTTK